MGKIEAGCDEAGRGCLAGPVYAAAVILPEDYKNKLLNDSKKLSEKQRNQLRIEIEKEALDWAVSSVSAQEIDEINILNASILAMHRSLDKLRLRPQILLIDGNRFKQYRTLEHHCIVKGDGEFLSIAAASVLAKTHRDEWIYEQAPLYPQYHWQQNKSYATAVHRAAISQYGLCPLHRKTFHLKKQLSLNL